MSRPSSTRCSSALADIPNGEVFFVGADDALAREPLADLLPRFHPGTASSPPALTGTSPAFSNAKARRLLGWRPADTLAHRTRRAPTTRKDAPA